MSEPAKAALPTDRVGRVAIAMFTLYVRSCGPFDARLPSRAKVAREWHGQSAFLREGWLKDARYVLRAADVAADPGEGAMEWREDDLGAYQAPVGSPDRPWVAVDPEEPADG